MAATEAMIWVLLKSDGSIEMPYAQEMQGWCARHGKEVKIELLDLGTEAGGAGVVSAAEKLRREAVDEFSDPGAYRAGFTYDTQTPDDVEAVACYGGLCHGCGKNVEKRYVKGWQNLCAYCALVPASIEQPAVGPGRILHVDGKPVWAAPYHTLSFGAVGQPPPKPPALRDMLELLEAADNVYRRLTATVTACDCGAAKTGTTHADYCSTRKP